MKVRQTRSLPWYNRRSVVLVEIVLGAAAAYACALRAIDTGSLQQYTALMILIVLIGQRCVRLIRPVGAHA